jgi:PKD repeat protein
MKSLKKIILLIFLLENGIIFSQNAKENYIPPSPLNLPPEANFSWLHACLGDSTCFINQTIRGNTYTWTVTDTNSHHPVTLFTSTNDSGFCYLFPAGAYSVSLSAYNNHLVTTTKLIIIDTVTKADFSFIHCGNHFVNISSCASSFYWDFGDGTNSTLAIPDHQYADTGHYNVSLIVYKGSISDTLKQQIVVDVTSFASGIFTHTVSHDTLFVHATFSGAGTNYYWTWADGTYSTGQDTFHVYKDSTAFYNVELFVINSCGPALSFDTIGITQQIPAVADFSFTNTCFGDSACFTNLSAGGITYTWTVYNTLGNMLDSSTNNSGFCFLFPARGIYYVKLLANNNFSITSTVKTIIIDTLPRANFSFTHCSNNFSNLSSCAYSFDWDFGDGGSSSITAPIHQYADTGYYNVTLIAHKGALTDTLSKQIHVDVTSSPIAAFTSSSSNDTLQVHANYSSIANAIYNWNFGDGGHATGKDTVHIYADTVFTYQVKLTVTNLCGTISNTNPLHIIVPEPPAGLNFDNTTLLIVPNPVANNSYLEAFYTAYTNDIYLGQVYDALGQKMFEANFAFTNGINGFKINTSDFAGGMYVLKLQSGNSFVRKKFYIAQTDN